MKILKRFNEICCIAAKGRDERGQALIELAVSLPLLLLLLLGAAELSSLAYFAIEVSDAAKAAAQYGSLDAAHAEDSAGLTKAAQKNAPYAYANCTNFTATAQNSGTAANPLPCTCITNGTPSPATPTYAACSAVCTSPSYSVQEVVVTTSATCSPFVHAPGFTLGSVTLSGHAVQEVLN